MKEILTYEYLTECYSNGMSSKDISEATSINSRTIRCYMKKLSVKTLKFKKDKIVWNKGLTANSNEVVRKSCLAAQKARKGKPSWNKGLKVGSLRETHKEKISISLRGKYVGELSSNWKGGVTNENKLLRTSSAFKEWRKNVFERDNYTCQICNKRGGELHPDHIKQFAYYPDLRFDLNNGRTLCGDCHRKTDTWGNKKSKINKIQTII